MSVNKVILLGNLGFDPEVIVYGEAKTLTRLRLATSEFKKERDGTLKRDTQWHTILVFGKAALSSAKYLKKGSLVLIEGRLSTREYQDNSGVKRRVTEILASSVKFLGSAGDSLMKEVQVLG